MRIVKVIGGLGNQMFQFALYKVLQRLCPEERVLLDLHCFKGYHKHHGFEINNVFGADYEEATFREVARLAYPYPNFQAWRIGSRILPVRQTMLKEEANSALEPTALCRKGDTYYDGYWQHEDYFAHQRELILDTFQFPAFTDERDTTLAHQAANCNSVAIHVRRGDYVTDKLFKNISTTDYYTAAIQELNARVSPELILIFSNDIAWCQENISKHLQQPTIYVDWHAGADSYRDMQLMTFCKHHIIANSSFSWWGAWLHQGEQQIVICPEKWMNIHDSVSPAPASWIRISSNQ